MSHLDPESRQEDHVSSDAPVVVALKPVGTNANLARRRIAKLGVGAPIVMSLASKHALAGQCLSNMLSGNLSNPDQGHCSKGWSPGGWAQPGGQIFTYTTPYAWTKAGFNYGTYKTSCGNASRWDCYIYGTLLSEMPSVLNRDGINPTLSVRAVLNTYEPKLTRHLLTAYLNACLGEAESNYEYILTKQQVLDLASGALMMPSPYTDLKAFLDSTWQ